MTARPKTSTRVATLLTKELRQNALALAALALTMPLAYAVVALGTAAAPDTVTPLMTHAVFLWGFVPLSGLVLGNRLVVLEYHGRTQLFVEALPVRRIEMVAVKYVMGLAILWAIATGELLVTTLLAARSEPIGPRFLGLMALRTTVFVFCAWSLLFAMGFLGRFRVPLYVGMLVVLFVLDSLTELEISRFPVFALVGQQLVLDRESMPWADLGWTFGLGMAWVATAATLALIDEGSVAESLARRMTFREKAVAGALFIAAMLATTVLEERRDQAPFAFRDQAVLRSRVVPLEIFYVREGARADAEALRARLEADLVELGTALGRGPGAGEHARMPAVRVALRESLDAETFETVGLAKNDGVLVRADFRRTSAWDAEGQRAFRAYLVREALREMTDGRAGFEPRAWVHDGFSRAWVDRDRAGACLEAPEGCPALLRALWATRGGRRVRARDLREWFRTRERDGEAVAWGLASSGVLVLGRDHGQAAVTALARRLYGRTPSRGTRELVREWLHPLPALFREAAGLHLDRFLDEWNTELDRLRTRAAVAAELARVPEAEADLVVERGEGRIRDLVAHVRLEGADPEGGEVVATMLHGEIGPFDRPLERHELRRDERVLAAEALESGAAELRLAGQYGPGVRVFAALELDAPALGCPVRVLAERRDVR
jgi:hypothetical protein